eukprot:g26820.t1
MLQQQAEEDRRPQPDRGSDGQIIRLLLLCGLPGSGKSTLAARFAASPDWTVVNQDTWHNKHTAQVVASALRETEPKGSRWCRDRALWTRLAKTEFHLSPSELACAWLDVPQEECARRVLQRFGHRTLPPQEASSKVIGGFARHFEEPQLTASAEGFGRVWRLRCEADEALLANELSLPTAAAQLPKPQRTVHPRKAKNKIPSQDFQPQQAPLEAPPEVRPDQLPEPKRVEKKSPAGGLVAPPETWTCSCGEINKIRRELCNNCFLPQSKRDEQASKLAISPCPDALSTCMSCATPPASALGTSDEAALQTIHAGPGESDAGGDESPSQTELRLLQRLRVPRVSADFEAEDTVVEGDLEDRDLPMKATLADGHPLPPWLFFDPKSHRFHGTPGQGDGGLMAVRVTAHDRAASTRDAAASGAMLPLRHFKLETKASVGQNFIFKEGVDGRPLPSWLHFDRATGTFSGMPQATDTGPSCSAHRKLGIGSGTLRDDLRGPLSVEVFAEDPQGGEASDSFDVVSTDLESVVLRDAIMHTAPGTHNFWIMMMCISLIFFAFVILLVAVGIFGFKVSIKRRFMRENKDQAPGTLRSVQCCGAQPERPEGSGRSRAGPDRNRTRGAFRWSGPEEVG